MCRFSRNAEPSDAAAFAAAVAPPARRLRLCCLAVLLGGLAIISPAPLRADDAEQLERFLARLGLVDLQILHLEQSLQAPSDEEARLKFARQLADLYAARLMELADDPQRYDEMLGRIQQLVERHPRANTTALGVMLLQADYNRAETLVGQWMAAPDDDAPRQQAAAILARISPQLQSQQKELTEQADALAKELDELEEGDQYDQKQRELARLQAIAGRAAYFASWASYYLGLTRPGGAAAAGDFAQARLVFRKLLGLTEEDKDYTKVEPEWLGLESAWRARAVIGLGLAEAAAGNLAESEAVFAWLDSAAVTPAIRDQAAYWYVQGLINAREFAAAQSYASKKIAQFAGGASQGKVSLCVALVRAGFAAGAEEVPAAKALGPLGISGLAKLRQFPALKALVEKFKIDLAASNDFYLMWIRGQQQFDAAEKTKQPADYKAAAETLAKALASDQAKSDVAAAAQCTYNLAWCRYRLGEYAQAAREFEQCVTGLKAGDAELAAQSAWMAYAAYSQLVKASPTAASSAISILELLKRDFPSSSFAARADYHIARLRTAAASPDEMLAALEKIKPGEANYLAARYDMAMILARKWKESPANTPAAKAALDALRAAVDVFLQAAGSSEPQRQMSAALKVVEAALASDPPQRELAASYLQRAAAAVPRVPQGDASLADFHFQSMQFARLAENAAARREHAQWLAENAAGSSYELAALVTLASALEAELASASPQARSGLAPQAHRVYARLAQAYGDSPGALKSQKNARVALSKLAYYAHELGRYDEALAALEKLLAEFPKERDYLRRAALAAAGAGEHAEALEKWTVLLRGLQAGSSEWFEAKYQQIGCLAHTDKAAAAKVFAQFELLYPDLGGVEWQAKFQQLKREL